MENSFKGHEKVPAQSKKKANGSAVSHFVKPVTVRLLSLFLRFKRYFTNANVGVQIDLYFCIFVSFIYISSITF